MKKILIQLDTDEHPSTFDSMVAHDAGVDALLRYGGIEPDAVNQTIVLNPHLPSGWENIAIHDLPVGKNQISFSRSKTEKGIEYDVAAKDDNWTFVLKPTAAAGARVYLNGREVTADSSGIRMRGRQNHVLVASQ